MKELELSVEEKAKQYDVAKQIMEEYMKSGGDAEAIDTIKRAFPELENMDEKIIKKIIHLVKKSREQGGYALHEWEAKEMLAWLEKKKNEQENNDDDFTIYHPLKNGKGEYECIPYSFYGSLVSFSEDKDLIDFLHTCFYTQEECEEWIRNHNKQEWSEEDEEMLEDVRDNFEFNKGVMTDALIAQYDRFFDKIKYLQPQSKQEWSEEDENTIDEAVEKLENYAEYVQGGNSKQYILDLASRVESLKPQPHWKPSDEQIEALRVARDRNDKIGFYLSQLYDDLKNLNKS